MKAAPRGGFLPNNGAGERADAKLSSGAAAVSQCPYIISSGFCPGVLACAKNELFESSAASLEKTAPPAPFPFFIELNDIFEGHFYHTPTHRKTTTSLKGPLNVPARKCFFDAVACEQPLPCVLPFTAPTKKIHDHAAHHFRNKKIERLRAQALWRSIFSFLRHSAVKAETEHPVVGGFFTFSRGAVPNLRERAV